MTTMDCLTRAAYLKAIPSHSTKSFIKTATYLYMMDNKIPYFYG